MRIKIPRKAFFEKEYEITEDNVILNSIKVIEVDTEIRLGFTILATGTNHYKIIMPNGNYMVEYEHYFNTKSLSNFIKR